MHCSGILNGEIGPIAGCSKRKNHLLAVRDYCVLANKPFEIEPIKPLRAQSYVGGNTMGSPVTRRATEKTMIPHPNRRPIFELAAAAPRALVKFGRHRGGLVLEALQRAYGTHLERAQMRLAPAKSRSWHDIPRAGAHHHYC